MDEIKQMELLTKLEAMQTRLLDNIKEIKDDFKELKVDVREIKQIVPTIHTRLAIIEDKKLDERITSIEKWMWKAIGALVVIQILVTTAISLTIKAFFN